VYRSFVERKNLFLDRNGWGWNPLVKGLIREEEGKDFADSSAS
jgi:hypothetical protein